jgi:fused signal recognition particle receptor
MARWNIFSRKKNKDVDQAPAKTDEATPAPAVADPVAKEPDNAAAVSTKPVEPKPTESKLAEPKSVDPNPAESAPAEPPKKKVGMFGRLKQAMVKTYKVLNTDIRDLVGKEGRLVDDEFLSELFAMLIKTDMGSGPASKIRDQINSKFRARKVMMSDLVNSAKLTIREVMAQEQAGLNVATSGPTVIMVVGVNGSGKTTSIAKLAYQFKSEGKSVVLGAGDTFRAAAVEQLTIWAERLGANIIKGKDGSDPASVAYQAAEYAVKNNVDICIVDTAGRLQTQTNLMDQLTKIKRVVGKVIADAPHEVLLVLDATAGQNAISQARGFSDAADCTGIVLAKLDGTAKGGVAIPIRQEFNLPVKFIGLGETPDAIQPFDVDRYVDALFDAQ